MLFDSFGGLGIMFAIIPILVSIGFIVVIGMLIYRAAQGAQRWKRNNDSPVLTVDAKVVAKRSDVSFRHSENMVNDNMDMRYSNTYYYITFEVASGDRMEFNVPDTEYGLLTEGDKGSLTFQGTRYISYVRDTRI